MADLTLLSTIFQICRGSQLIIVDKTILPRESHCSCYKSLINWITQGVL